MQSQAEVVNLHNLAKGAVIEKFEHELNRVMENIRDVNTDSKKARKITVAVTLSPYSDRSGAEITVNVESKLAPLNAIKSTLFIDVHEGEYRALSKDVRQQELPLEPSNVLPMAAGK